MMMPINLLTFEMNCSCILIRTVGDSDSSFFFNNVLIFGQSAFQKSSVGEVVDQGSGRLMTEIIGK